MDVAANLLCEAAPTVPVTVAVLLKDAARMQLFAFLDKHNGQFLDHPRWWVAPTQAHDTMQMADLDPTELEDWNEALEDSPNHVATTTAPPPVLVNGLPWSKYRSAVIDGHHRYKARRAAGKTDIDIIYDVESLTSLWLRANHRPDSEASSRRLADDYRAYLTQLDAAETFARGD